MNNFEFLVGGSGEPCAIVRLEARSPGEERRAVKFRFGRALERLYREELERERDGASNERERDGASKEGPDLAREVTESALRVTIEARDRQIAEQAKTIEALTVELRDKEQRIKLLEERYDKVCQANAELEQRIKLAVASLKEPGHVILDFERLDARVATCEGARRPDGPARTWAAGPPDPPPDRPVWDEEWHYDGAWGIFSDAEQAPFLGRTGDVAGAVASEHARCYLAAAAPIMAGVLLSVVRLTEGEHGHAALLVLREDTMFALRAARVRP